MNEPSAQKRSVTASRMRYRCVFIKQTPQKAAREELAVPVGLTRSVLPTLRYDALPLLALIVDEQGIPIWPASLFLASSAVASNGTTGDTVRTYAESLLPWLEFIEFRGLKIDSVDEETLKLYRVKCVHGLNSAGRKYSSATANLRVTVAIQFHRWCEANRYTSPLGNYLIHQHQADKTLTTRVINKLPKILSLEETQRIMYLTKNPYKLMMRWGLVTGLRRHEVCNLKMSELPTPEETPFFSDGLARLDIVRKGGRTITAYAPTHLIEETNWYILTERGEAKADFEDFVFTNKQGRKIDRQAVSREFRRCANEIGSRATLHHLRHTFAAHVLNFLESHKSEHSGNNTLKTLQVLLGHSHIETTEVYLRAIDITNPAVVAALDHLYGVNP
jgi:integrase